MNSLSRSNSLMKFRSKICVSVAQEGIDAMYEDAKKAFDAGADLVELRLDYLSFVDMQAIRKRFAGFDKRLILTLRKREEGGKFQGVEADRIQLLKQLQSWDGQYKDIELSTAMQDGKLVKDAKSTIISWHDFNSTPSQQILKEKLSAAMQYGAIAKIVTTAKELSDNLAVLNLYNKKLRGKLAAFCMGEQGKVSRILAPMLGSPFMYGCLEGETVAPGQIPIAELRGFYELLEIT